MKCCCHCVFIRWQWLDDDDDDGGDVMWCGWYRVGGCLFRQVHDLDLDLDWLRQQTSDSRLLTWTWTWTTTKVTDPIQPNSTQHNTYFQKIPRAGREPPGGSWLCQHWLCQGPFAATAHARLHHGVEAWPGEIFKSSSVGSLTTNSMPCTEWLSIITDSCCSSDWTGTWTGPLDRDSCHGNILCWHCLGGLGCRVWISESRLGPTWIYSL